MPDDFAARFGAAFGAGGIHDPSARFARAFGARDDEPQGMLAPEPGSALDTFEQAPTAPGPGATPDEKTEYHTARANYDLASRNQGRAVGRAKREVDANAKAHDDRQAATDEARFAQTFADSQRLAGGGAAFQQVAGEQDAADRAAHPDSDTIGERIRKSLIQNWGGLQQQFAGTERYAIENAAALAGRVIPGAQALGQAAQPFVDQAAAPATSALDHIHKAAQADIDANQYKLGGKGDYYAQNMIDSIVQMVPTVATAYLTKGGSLEAEAAAEGAAQSTNPIVRFMAKYGEELRDQQASLTVLGTQQGGQQYGKSRADGRTVGQSDTDALVFGLAEAIPEAMPLGMAMKPGGHFLPRLLKTAGMEAPSEMLTQAVEDGYSAGVLKQDMTWGQAVQNMVDAGIVGFGMGAALGGGSHLVHEARGGDEAAAGRDMLAEINGADLAGGHSPTDLLDPNRDILPVPRQPTAPGLVETAATQPAATPEDEASPLPTDLIEQGRRRIATVEAQGKANEILGQHQAPKVGTEVTLSGKRATIDDAFTDDSGEAGVTLRFASGQTQKVYLNDLADAGISLDPAPAPSAAVDQAPTAAPSPAAPSARADPDAAIRFVMNTQEGGGKRTVDSGGVTRFGISQNAHPEVNVDKLTEAQAVDIYRRQYWDKLGLDNTDPRFAVAALDTAINHGMGKGPEIVAEAHGDTDKLLALRQQEYDRLARENPAKYGQYANGWRNRLEKLAAEIGTGPAPVMTDVAPVTAEAPTDTTSETNFLTDPLLPPSNEHSFLDETPAAQPEPALATPAPAEPADLKGGDPFAAGEAQPEPAPHLLPETPSVTVENKQLVLRDITPEQRIAVDVALPGKARLLPRSDGAFVAAVKHEDAVRAVLSDTQLVQPRHDLIMADAESLPNRSEGRSAPPHLNSSISVPPDATETVRPDAASAQGLNESRVGQIHLEGDLSDVQPAIDHGFSSLDVATRSRVLQAVLGRFQDHQVFDAVIKSIPIDVVNDLASPQRPAEILLHDPAMFVDALSANHSLPVRARSIDAIVGALASPTAVDGVGPARGSAKDAATGSAYEANGQFNSPVTVGQNTGAIREGASESLAPRPSDAPASSVAAERAPQPDLAPVHSNGAAIANAQAGAPSYSIGNADGRSAAAEQAETPSAPAADTSEPGTEPRLRIAGYADNFASDAERATAVAGLHTELKRRGVEDKLAMRAVDLIQGDPRIAGKYHRRMIEVALDSYQKPTLTLNHEVVHGLKEMGAYRTAEWKALTRAAVADPELMASVQRRYPHLDHDGQVEEAIADLSAGHVDGSRPQKGLMRTGIDRALEFIRALGEALRGNGFATSHGTLAKFESGEIGRRGEAPRAAAEQASPMNRRAFMAGAAAVAGTRVMEGKGLAATGHWQDRYARKDWRDRLTKLTPEQERQFQQWAARNHAPITPDYDMRGFWLHNGQTSVNPNDHMVHYSDTYKTPLHHSFSGESIYADPKTNPPKWNDRDQLVAHDGTVLFDERAESRYSTLPADGHLDRSPPEAEAESDGSTTPPLTDMIENEGGGGGKGTGSDTFDTWRTALQDRMLPLLRTQQRIETALGRELDEDENPYLAEELMTGKVGARLDKLSDDLVNPLFAAMKEEGVSVGEIESYLYARHAAERNAQIAKINPEFSEGEGSGMTDIEAAAILARIEKAGRTEAMERVAGKVDAILRFAVDTRVEAGLLSRDEAEAWRQTYEHYVPLRGQAENEDSANPERPRSGSGINVRGKESQRAFGRRSKASDILAHSIMQAQEAIVRAETNEVGQRLLALAKDFPDANFWTIDKVRQTRFVHPTTGQVTKRSESRIAAEDAPYTVSLKVDGEEHRVTFNRDNPDAMKLADAMRNLTGQQFNAAVAFLGKFTRFFSAINTRYAPPFIVTNAIRDAMTASVTLQQYNVPGLVTGTIRDYRHALVAPRNGDGEWSKWRREFELAGGKIYFNDIGDINTLRKKIEKQVNAAARTPTALGMKAKAFFDGVQTLNDHVENAIRLAAYKNAREGGLSRDKAASIARNVTVNFTRRGKYGPVINSAYAFFNASTQGSATLILAAMRSRKVRASLGGFMVAGFLLDMLNNMIGDDDDDGASYWSKIPEFEKERNLILMVPGGKGREIKLPLGLGLNAFFNTGRVISEIASGRRSPLSGAGEALWGFADGFNPLNGGGSVLNYILPTIADPIGELVVNRNFAGKPIQPDQSPYDPPVTPSANFTPNVNPVAKALTDAVNKATGGDEVQPGRISVSPNVVQYLFGYFTGSAGRFYSDVMTLPFQKDATINDVPFVNKVVGDKPVWYDKSVAYARLDDIEQRLGYAKGYQKAGDAEGLQSFVGENGAELQQLVPLAKWTRKEMGEIRKARGVLDVAHDRERIDDATFKADKDRLDAVEQAVIFAFNKRYLEVAVKPVGLKP